MIKKLITIILLIFLIRSPAYGHEWDYLDGLPDTEKYCDKNPDHNKYVDKLNKQKKKREVYYHKCILKHAKNQSDGMIGDIRKSCEFFAKEKYKFPSKVHSYTTKFSGMKIYSSELKNHCHSHKAMTLREKFQNVTIDGKKIDISKPPPKKQLIIDMDKLLKKTVKEPISRKKQIEYDLDKLLIK